MYRVHPHHIDPMSLPNSRALAQSMLTSARFLHETCLNQYMPLHSRNPTPPELLMFLSSTLI